MRCALLALGVALCVGCIEEARTPDDAGAAEPEPQPAPQPAPQPSMEPAPQPSMEPAPQPTVEPEPEPPLREPAVHRPVAEACDDTRRPGTTPDDPAIADCQTDDDCQDGDNGRCTGNAHDGWYCTYDRCFADDGCDNVCQCSGGFRSDHNVCVGGNCRVDADCGPGGYCSPTFGDCGGYTGIVAWYCHTAADTCIDDADCDGDPQFGFDPYCAYDPARGHWACADQHCVGK